MPLGLLLLRARGIVPRAAGCERKSGDAVPTRQRSHLGIVTEIADQHDFVQATAHVFLLARGILDLAAYSVIQPTGTSNRFHAARTEFAKNRSSLLASSSAFSATSADSPLLVPSTEV